MRRKQPDSQETFALERLKTETRMMQCQIDYDWNMSSCFSISLGCFARKAVHYEAVSVNSACSATLIRLGQGLISFPTLAKKNKPAHVI